MLLLKDVTITTVNITTIPITITITVTIISYEAALEKTGLRKLSDRQQSRCLEYGLKSLKNPVNKRYFPENPNLDLSLVTREREKYHVNFARTRRYQQSAIPYIQRLLNQHAKEKEMKRLEEGEVSRSEGEVF